MFDQEIMFKKQVHKVDRVYGGQRSLVMGDSKYSTRCGLFPMKRTFAESHLVGSTRSVLNQDFGSIFQQRYLDLRLLTGNSCNEDVLNGEEVHLSLSIGTSTNKRSRISEKSWKNKIVYPSSHDTIDLEVSTVTGANEDVYKIFSLHQSSQSSTDHLKNVMNLQQDYLKIDPFCKKTESSMNGCMHQEWSNFNQGSNSCHDVKPKIVLDFDLNEAQPDESSFHSNDPFEAYPSSDGSCGESCSRTATHLTLKGQTKAYTIDLESPPEGSSDLTEEAKIQKETEDSDYMLQKAAALLLMSISRQQTSTCNQDSETKKKVIQPSSSVDSYEQLVLKLEPSNVDEDCATSKAFEIREFDQKEKGIKLKRGRRLKDFQKDILPTLSSLSRHKILEDINLLEGVIRSREYKRLHRAKTSKGENCFTPVKSRRSKVSYIGQKKSDHYEVDEDKD